MRIWAISTLACPAAVCSRSRSVTIDVEGAATGAVVCAICPAACDTAVAAVKTSSDSTANVRILLLTNNRFGKEARDKVDFQFSKKSTRVGCRAAAPGSIVIHPVPGESY